jgi:chromosome segregation ATPase
MAKRPPKPAPKPAPRLSAHQLGVILERVEEQQRMVIEAVVSNRETLERKIDAVDARLGGRIDVLEVAVRSLSGDLHQARAEIRQNTADIRQNTADIRQNSADIRQNSADIRQNSADIRQNTEDIRQNTEDIRALDAKLDRKADTARVVDVEARLAVLEAIPS